MGCYSADPAGGGESIAEDIKARIASELAKVPGAVTVLCYVDDQPAGLINCLQSFSTFKCKPLLNIHDVVVAPSFRGRGISQIMLYRVEQIAHSRGCCKLTLEVLQGNEIAQGAYRKFGFSGYELDQAMGTALFWQKPL